MALKTDFWTFLWPKNDESSQSFEQKKNVHASFSHKLHHHDEMHQMCGGASHFSEKISTWELWHTVDGWEIWSPVEVGGKYPIIYDGVLYILVGCSGFLNHQPYPVRKKKNKAMTMFIFAKVR